MEKGKRAASWLYFLTIVVILLLNIIPLTGEYLFTMHGWKSYFLDFHLTDEDGRGHSGFFGLGTIPLADGEIFQYAFEAGEGAEVAKRKQKVTRDLDPDGFHWGDRGYLWSGMLDYLPERQGLVEGSRINRKIEPWQQGELTGPGAPWDIKGPRLSVLGNYPRYIVDYEDEYFKFHLEYKSRASGWYLWNQGETFTTGDFGHGNMSELPCNITGEINHKKDNSSYKVSGWGLMEDAVGNPWCWYDWGDHNWFSSNYPNGWAVDFWLAPDDWQWGYHPSPHELWVYDATRGKYYHAKRVEFLSYEWGREEINGMKFPTSYRVRAVTDAGAVEISARSLTFKPILADVKYVPLDIKMAYSKGVMEGTFTYLDGSTVELADGVGTMEYFPSYVPNMIYITPWSLALLTLLVGGRRIRKHKNDRVKVKRAIWGTLVCLTAVVLLTIIWM
ncbi:MAG: hypothetical protein JSU92_06260 [Deltaproteobacteria bacterium]|nr:MAG: hypothetical protein JSU92_06260 [Deltaproteobacteria bacterium]